MLRSVAVFKPHSILQEFSARSVLSLRRSIGERSYHFLTGRASITLGAWASESAENCSAKKGPLNIPSAQTQNFLQP
jgi:hypothetical protein